MNNIKKCDQFLSVKNHMDAVHSQRLDLEECMSLNILQSPDSRKPLSFDSSKQFLTDGFYQYPIKSNIPILHSRRLIDKIGDGCLKLDYYEDPLLQYYLLNQIKNYIIPNAPTDSRPYEKHLFRISKFCENLRGLILDIGCYDPLIGSALFPKEAKYLGLDPMLSGDSFRVSSIAEILPFADKSFDNIVFSTSLDHILDYHTAIEEAYRVLKDNGMLIIDTYIWEKRATLLTDIVHFHHFRYDEITNALHAFTITEEIIYECPKGDEHRHELLIMASKSNT